SQHNSLGLYLLSLTKSCDDIFEPKLEELINQLKEDGILGSLDSGVVQDDQIMLDPNSNLGMFVGGCILAFHFLLFELKILYMIMFVV
ncbi:unnamed protein product, partial [Thlaspi arvense]